MAIRTNHPVSPLTQIRLRLELASRRTRRALEQRRRSLRAQADARLAAKNEYLRLRWLEDLQRERRAFAAFYDQHDALVGLLCLAAQEGATPAIEGEYAVRRAWFCAHYPPLKRTIGMHLLPKPPGVAPLSWGRRGCDAFEALFSAPTLTAALARDGGRLIDCLTRTQVALEFWEKSIAREESACGRAAPPA